MTEVTCIVGRIYVSILHLVCVCKLSCGHDSTGKSGAYHICEMWGEKSCQSDMWDVWKVPEDIRGPVHHYSILMPLSVSFVAFIHQYIIQWKPSHSVSCHSILHFVNTLTQAHTILQGKQSHPGSHHHTEETIPPTLTPSYKGNNPTQPHTILQGKQSHPASHNPTWETIPPMLTPSYTGSNPIQPHTMLHGKQSHPGSHHPTWEIIPPCLIPSYMGNNPTQPHTILQGKQSHPASHHPTWETIPLSLTHPTWETIPPSLTPYYKGNIRPSLTPSSKESHTGLTPSYMEGHPIQPHTIL